jgi:hypothetical protein
MLKMIKVIAQLLLFGNLVYVNAQQEDDFYHTDPIDFHNECVRQIPEPLVDTTKFPDAAFRMENFVGFETADLSDTEKLIIKNTGCESYTLVLRFEVPAQEKTPDDVIFWYDRLVGLIEETGDYINSPINIKEANLELFNHINNFIDQPVQLEDYFLLEDLGIPKTISFDKILDIGSGKIALEFCIRIGPL